MPWISRRLAFSTLGCPGMPLHDVAALALGAGWRGLELRSAPDEPVHVGLSEAGRRAALDALDGLSTLCVASYVKIASGQRSDEQCVADLLAEAGLAADLGARAVRVFPGGDDEHADARAIARLRAAAPRLPSGVEIWLETHDSHPRGEDLRRILSQVHDPRVRAIWDVRHPWAGGESVADTARALAPWLAHVQLKDSADADRTPLLLGTGAVPLREILHTLRADGYDGWYSLEWERKWHPGIVPLADALIAGRDWLATLDTAV
ncbi:sugar phosphate isomerase/epimerase [Dactylosporangium fulvum]|uniref:Sugar phosphate isomerase/epimerase n=1 Tax=Dactylosporangium fulvum TaxID=53359 RepID=A0ABY5VSB0_9ACTN|nr:sugar phosphate isomerase/epimerase family protein [Dactylosporangium fulvum]UWP80034.1 sugar phosphate isomerase/epimerase [Dactylosporangium fulvum]